jgi:hypothetical protein
MYEGAKVSSKEHGIGIVVLATKCQGQSGDNYLLTIEFEERKDQISLYDDEVDLILNS